MTPEKRKRSLRRMQRRLASLRRRQLAQLHSRLVQWRHGSLALLRSRKQVVVKEFGASGGDRHPTLQELRVQAKFQDSVMDWEFA